MARYLVTGGAGYVGSHVVLALRDRGDEVVVLDNFSTGHRAAVPEGVPIAEVDLADQRQVGEVFAGWHFDAVFHMAALSLVGESMKRPLHYIRTNVNNSVILAEAAIKAGVKRLVFSSTAAIFGVPRVTPIGENTPAEPVNPYGESKLMVEQALAWADGANGLRTACLRYFNAAGADPVGRAGEDHMPETHLIPRAILGALGRAEPVSIFGTDYDTPDGTPLRDYVHVTDLAAAHLAVLPRLEEGSVAYNIGNGTGYSVKDVLAAIEQVSGRPVPHSYGPRREGDPPSLVASSERLRAETGWQPAHDTLDEIVRTAWAWHVAHPEGYASPVQVAA